MAAVVLGIKVLNGYLSYVEFSHVCRQCNRPGHLLAKHAIGIVDFIAWFSSP